MSGCPVQKISFSRKFFGITWQDLDASGEKTCQKMLRRGTECGINQHRATLSRLWINECRVVTCLVESLIPAPHHPLWFTRGTGREIDGMPPVAFLKLPDAGMKPTLIIKKPFGDALHCVLE